MQYEYKSHITGMEFRRNLNGELYPTDDVIEDSERVETLDEAAAYGWELLSTQMCAIARADRDVICITDTFRRPVGLARDDE